MIDRAVRAKLLSVAAIAAAVGGTGAGARVWVNELPQSPTPKWPAITYQLISGRPEYTLSSTAGVAEVRIQIDCWSGRREDVSAYDEVRDLAELVRGALSAFKGTSDGVVIQSCFLVGRRVLSDDETGTDRESLDFLVSYTEA